MQSALSKASFSERYELNSLLERCKFAHQNLNKVIHYQEPIFAADEVFRAYMAEGNVWLAKLKSLTANANLSNA
jgi:hypothetical protein